MFTSLWWHSPWDLSDLQQNVVVVVVVAAAAAAAVVATPAAVAAVVASVAFPARVEVRVLVFNTKSITGWVASSVPGCSVGPPVKVKAVVGKRAASALLGPVSDGGGDSAFLFSRGLGGVVKKATVEEFIGRGVAG